MRPEYTVVPLLSIILIALLLQYASVYHRPASKLNSRILLLCTYVKRSRWPFYCRHYVDTYVYLA